MLRLWHELRAQGFETGRDRIVRLRKELGLHCRQERKFKATTNSKWLPNTEVSTIDRASQVRL